MTQLNVITTAEQIRVWDTGWGCNSKKKKRKNINTKHHCVNTMAKM